MAHRPSLTRRTNARAGTRYVVDQDRGRTKPAANGAPTRLRNPRLVHTTKGQGGRLDGRWEAVIARIITELDARRRKYGLC